MYGESTSEKIERAASQVVDAAYVVHNYLGPGLLEDVYEECLARELAKRGRRVLRQVRVPLYYDGAELATPLRIDLLVDDCVIVEVKAVEKLHPIFEAQVLTYLKLTKLHLGLLLNFNVEFIKHGIKRVIRSSSS